MGARNELKLAEQTVRNYVSRIYGKYVTSNTAPGIVTVIGDHDTICSGIAPAAVDKAGADPITLEFYSIAGLVRSDVNKDGEVDIFDLVIVAARFGSNDPLLDLNSDGTVDIFDLTLVAGNYGQTIFSDRLQAR